MTQRRNLDTQGIGKRAFTAVQTIFQNNGHLIQPIDGDTDIGIDGYLRLRKRVKFKKVEKNKEVLYENTVDTGNLVGVQVKGVTKIPEKKSNSYYIIKKDKTCFGVNFKSRDKLNSKKEIWENFVGPVILVFIDLSTNEAWWANLNDQIVFDSNGYSVNVKKENKLDASSFKHIKKLGKELFSQNELIIIKTDNSHFTKLSVASFKESAKDLYRMLGGKEDSEYPMPATINPVLGEIKYTRSGWKHMTRLNRRQMRIINSLTLLFVSKLICEEVTKFTKVKKGEFRESRRFIKKVEYLTLRANVEFNFRQDSIVQVVLRRVRTFDKFYQNSKIPAEIFFHSIYEPYRKE